MEAIHVVMIPYPAQGHIKPMFMLAELLSQADFKVTFINTDHTHARFLNQINQSSFCARFPNFTFYSITDGLPADHPRSGPAAAELLYSTSTACKPEFKELLTNISQENGKWDPPTCIISDGIMSFAIEVGEEFEIPVITFRTYNATCTWIYFFLQKLIDAGEVPVQGDDEDMDRAITCIPGLETVLRRRDLPSICRFEPDHPFIQFFVGQTSKMSRASALILNTFDDLEGPIVSQLHSIFPKIYTIGPLHDLMKSRADSPSSDSSNGSLSQQERTCITWLDSQPSKSVVFVSFGSLVVLSHDQLMEFWHGLVNSKKPFLWVIRADLMSENNKMGEVPAELMKETSERGCIASWVPQEEVLSHRAVGGFLTHSGWNSTLESICAGVPMICWPIITDQQVNSRCVSDIWKIGLDMKDTCNRSTVEKMVRDLMEGKREDILKSSTSFAGKASQSVKVGGSSYNNIDKLIEDIRSIKDATQAKNCFNN